MPMNEGDGLGMKVPYEVVYTGRHRFIDILRGQLPNMLISLLQKSPSVC
jgi:hypothetical protein